MTKTTGIYKWTQGHISSLERELAEAKDALAMVLSEGAGQSALSVGPVGHQYPIPDHWNLNFAVGARDRLWITRDLDPPHHITIRSGHGRLVVHPVAANAIRIEVQP